MKKIVNPDDEVVTRGILRSELEIILKEKLSPFYELINTVLKEIQDFREESAIFRSLHSRTADLEDDMDNLKAIHPEGKHDYPQAAM